MSQQARSPKNTYRSTIAGQVEGRLREGILHHTRSGGAPDGIAAMSPSRFYPGELALPLVEIVAALPSGIVISVGTPSSGPPGTSYEPARAICRPTADPFEQETI
ncbi:hypothetical protein [Palleronia aestuarii]|uniref:hypothetical protein n=1 Tax=Palleronia aestuarii TaxID=568105 RepID=UPI0011B53803|nr:hypothetical protein [Palleronia aestuarii]